MIKPNSLLRRKWFQITAATVGGVIVAGGAVGGGVAAAIIDVATKKAKDTISDLGITPDPGTKSNIDLGLFATANTKLNVVSLGDSVTAGYTTLAYTKEVPAVDADGKATTRQVTVDPQKNKDTLSYADYVASNLAKANKLASYNALAVSGQTSSGMLDTITESKNLPIIAKADLVMITIGANDILRAVKLLGVPYSAFQSILADPLGTTDITVFEKSESLGSIITTPVTTTVNNASYLPALFSTLQNVLTNGPEKLFSVDPVVLDTELVNALSNVLKALTFIHEKAPGAKIILNEYQFPFNRFVHDGKNITETPDPALGVLTFNHKAINRDTLRGVYDYVMANFKDKATAAFGVVTWNSMQQNQDALINLLTSPKADGSPKVIQTTEDGVALFQRDITDIHPTEYSHALIGQHIFNTYLAPYLVAEKQSEDYEYLRTAIVASSLPQKSYPMVAFLNFILKFEKDGQGNPTKAYAFAKRLVDKMVEEVLIATQVASLDKIDLNSDVARAALFTTPSFGMLTSLGPVLGGNATSAQKEAFTRSFDRFINAMIFDSGDTSLFDAFSAQGVFGPAPEFTRAAGVPAFYSLLGALAGESALARTAPVSTSVAAFVQRFVAESIALSDADKRTLENSMGLPASVFGTNAAKPDPATAFGMVYQWLLSKATWPGGTDPFPSSPAAAKASVASLMNLSRSAIRTNKIFADAAAQLVSMSAADKTAFLTSFGVTGAALDDIPDTILLLTRTYASSVPNDADGYANMPAEGKKIISTLIAELNKAVKYANTLAKVFPAAFFADYSTKSYTRDLTIADLKRGGDGQFVLIAQPAQS